MATDTATGRRAAALPLREVFHPPRPVRAALLAPLPSVVPLCLWAGGAIPGVQAIVTGAVLATIAGAHVGYVRFDLWRCHRLADDLLATGRHARASSPLVEWRARELTSDRTRGNLASWVRSVVHEESLFLLRRLEATLADLSHPVSASGVLAVRELLSDGATSPLYRAGKGEDLPDALAEALTALEGLPK